jgi:hypothetical protein
LDGSRFDDLARSLVTSRRGALRALLGGALATAAAIGRGTGAAAVPWDFYRVNQTCKNGEPCGALAPCTDGACRPHVCRIDGLIYFPGQAQPGDSCHVCDPTVGLSGWQQWTAGNDGWTCDIAFGAGCDIVELHCAAGACVPHIEKGQTLPGGLPCKHDEQCCHGVCCKGVCCSGNEVCSPLGCV